MQKKRLPHLVVTLALAVLAVDAGAMGFSAVAPSTTLGQGLDHVIGLRLDAGESLVPECVEAEVVVGEQKLPAAAVSTRIEGEGSNLALRVRTTVAIDEPLVALTVAVGCPVRLSRRFVLFADPAPASTPSAPVAAAADALVAAPAPLPAPAAVTDAPAAPAVQPGARERPLAVSGATPALPRPPRAAPRRAAPGPAGSVAAAPRARPRLRLDAAEPPPPTPLLAAEIIQAAASAAAAQAAAEAASAAAQRIATLEQAIDKLRADSTADREALLMLRQRAAAADVQAQWMPWLLALVAALAVLCGWLALRLRRLQHERQLSWWNAAATAAVAAPAAAEGMAAPTTVAGAAAPAVASGGAPSSGGYTTTRPGALGPVFTPDPALAELDAEGAVERTQALPVGWREDAQARRDVSIEELIDLEQQAEFFIVLGQEDAAVDLLVDHLRSTGGGSPMPYLKLLEIYRRRGDREAYDRTRARFNHRFNAYAPDWDDDPSQGRSLEDYPSIIVRLQQAWPSPIDAMAELESLLFRKSRGELFDMPAYRDVMFLYSLARDLLDREPLESGHVDVLLPINEGSDRTQPMSLADLPSPEDSMMVPLDQPTVPVDLDVTQPVMPESLFGENVTEPGVGGKGRRRRNPG